MRVVYLGRASRRTNAAPTPDGDVIELLSDNWNDFGYETSFPTVTRIGSRVVELGLVRLLINGVERSRDRLDELLAAGWNGEFPIPDQVYVSVPSEIAFYEQLDGALGSAGAIETALLLHDASHLVRNVEDADAIALSQIDGFQKSLQRERGSQKAFADGWRVFGRHDIAVLDLGFRFKDVCEKVSTLELKFRSDSLLPHDVNVLIGPNGSGKSRILHQIVEDWIDGGDRDDRGFQSKPNLSQIVVVSYSPFERFPVDLAHVAVQDDKIYRYFGFRGRGKPAPSNKRGAIRLSHQFPRRNASGALADCVADDQRYQAIRDWAQKVQTVERVLRYAFAFDFAALEVPTSEPMASFYTDQPFAEPLGVDIELEDGIHRYVPVSADRVSELNHDALVEHLVAASGVTFFRDGRPIELSSGQRLFAYIVINILGAIRRNSLILVDEPELFLHPTLEIQFIDMLKTILAKFNSKALLATHSVVTVREVPADCVHVIEKLDDEVIIKHPPFQTFGGDVQRISSYVFGDRNVSKPFERWIRNQIAELGSGTALLEALGDDVNEELVVQIKAMERGQW